MADTANTAALAIICDDCLKRVRVHWTSFDSTDRYWMGRMDVCAHIECHGEHRFIALRAQYFVTRNRADNTKQSVAIGRILDAIESVDPGQPCVQQLWSQIEDWGTKEELQQQVESLELRATEYLSAVKVIERVLKQQAPSPSDVKVMPERHGGDPEDVGEPVTTASYSRGCARCGGSGTVDRGPPAGDGPCPDCRTASAFLVAGR